MTSVWKRFFLVALFFCSLTAAMVAGIKSDQARAFLRRAAISWAAREWKLQVSMADLGVELLPPALVVENLVIAQPGEPNAPLLRLRHGRVRPRPWPTASGAFAMESLELEGLEADVPVDPSLFWPMPQTTRRGPPSRPRLPFDVKHLEVDDSRFTLRQGDQWLTATGVHMSMAPTSVGGRHITMSMAAGAGSVPGLWPDKYPLTFSARLEAQLQGSLDQPRVLIVDAASVELPYLQGVARGEVTLQPQVQVAITTTLGSRLADLSAHFAHLPVLEGDALADVDWRWLDSSQQLSTYVRMNCDNLQIDHHPMGDVQAEAAVGRDGAVVQSFRLTQPDGGAITGSGRVDFTAPMALQLSSRFHEASLPSILAAAGLPDAWVRMILSGDVQLSGSVMPLHLSLDADLDTRHFQVLGASYQHNDAPVMLAIDTGGIRGQANIDQRDHRLVTLQHVQVCAGRGGCAANGDASRLFVDGTFALDANTGLDLRAVGDAINFADVGPIAHVPFVGTGAIAAAIEGPYAAVNISASLRAEHLGVFDYNLGTSSAVFIFQMPTLQIDRITVLHGDGSVTGSGRLHFDRPSLEVEGAFDVADLDLGDTLRTLGAPAGVADPFHAAMSGRVLLSGPVAFPTGVAHVSGANLQVNGVGLGPVALEAAFGPGERPFSLNVGLKPQGGALQGRADLLGNGGLDIQGAIHDVPLALIVPLVGNTPLSGRLSGEVALHGPAEHFSGDVDVRVADLHAFGLRLEDTALKAQAHEGELAVDGSLLSGDVPIQGRLQLARRMPYHAQAAFKDLDVHRLWPHDDGTALRLWGTVVADGDLTDAASTQLDGAFSDIVVAWRGLQLESHTANNIHFANERFTCAPLQLASANLNLGLGGTLLLNGPLALDIRAQGDASVLSAVNPDIAAARGPFALNVHIGGTWEHPAYVGDASVSRGQVRLAEGEQSLEQLQARLTFSHGMVSLRDGSAVLGGGAVRFVGEANLDSELPEINVRSTMHNVLLRPNQDLEATVSGDAQLQGPWNDLLLKGRLKLDAVRYTARLELEHLIPRKSAPLNTRTTGGRPLRFNLKLQGANNIIVSSNVLEAELQADLTLTGTSERPGLLGNVTPLWARARYRDNTFKVVRASVDFTEEYRIFTEFSVQARTEACKIVADVNISGNSDGYTVMPYGQDEHGVVDPQDVLACLQFGLRLHDFDGNQRNAASFSDALPGTFDALWTVSGLDNKVKKLLPIDVDELRLTSGWSSLSQRTTARILVGKELGNQVALKYSRSLDEYNDQQLSVEYRLSDRAIMQGSWLSTQYVPVGDFGVDLRLHWEWR